MPFPKAPFQSEIQTAASLVTSVWQQWLDRVQGILNSVTGSGKTADRPTQDLYVGMPFFDTDLNQPVYWNGSSWTTSGTSGTVTSVTATAPVVSSGGNAPVISMAQSSASTNGYLSSTDWSTFDGKLDPSIKPSYRGTTYTGSATRPVTDMFGDYLSVIDFGADPTGVADSTTAFNTALSSSISSGNNGGRVFVPPGKYTINNQIVIPGGCSLVGAGRGNTWITQTNLNAAIFSLTGTAANNFVSGFYLTFASQSTTADGIYIRTPNVVVKDFYVFNANRAVVVDGNPSFDVTGVFISRGYILNFKTAGILVTNVPSQKGVGDIYIDGIEAWAGVPQDASWATSGVMSLSGPVNVRLSNSDLIAGAYALVMSTTGGLDTNNAPQFCTFTNVYFDSGYYGSIINGAIYSTFTGCWFSSGRGAGQAGLIINSANATLIEGATCFNCGSHGLQLNNGATMTAITGSVFNNNSSVASNTYHGVFVSSNTYNFSIVGCTASNSGPSGNVQAYGVYIQNGAQNFTVTGNCLHGNGISGLFDGTPNSAVKTVVGNTLPSNTNAPMGQNLQDVNGSRNIGTTYTNSRFSPMFVSVYITGSGSTVGSLTINGLVVCVQSTTLGPNGLTVQGVVPPGGTYKVLWAGGGLVQQAWTEC